MEAAPVRVSHIHHHGHQGALVGLVSVGCTLPALLWAALCLVPPDATSAAYTCSESKPGATAPGALVPR